jgi:hypothetical protein
MHDEIWRDIPGFEGYYMVSNLGRVKSLPRKTNNQYGKTERVLKPGWVKKKDSYKFVHLSKDGIRVKFLLHRLVAAAFIPNPNNLPFINHKDCNPENNRADNLEWCDARYNVNYGDRNEKAGKALSRKVYQYDKTTGALIATYDSALDAEEKVPGVWAQNIGKCCSGSLQSTGGFKWSH